MKFSTAFIGAVCFSSTMFQATTGMILEDGSDAQNSERRSLIKSRRGLWIVDHYIASVKHEYCDSVLEQLQQYREENGVGASGLRGDGDFVQEESIQIASSCYIPFVGDKNLYNAVQNFEGVEFVDPDLFVEVDKSPTWGLNRIDQSDLPLSKNTPFTASHTGAGVNVYVVDTGLNVDHNEFKGRSELGGDFVNENTKVDGNGHGTHCAGTAAGTEYGVAVDAQVIGVKVLSSSGSGSTSGVIKGVEWAVNENKGKAGVISMSLGGGKNSAMNKACEDAAKAGMIVVVAAGNENQDACNVSPASAGGSADKGGVITVGSTTSTDSRSSFSNYGKCVDIFAPGSSITSAWKGSKTATNTISGTSMATPHVAGVAAILLEKHNMDKDAAQAELLALAVSNRIKDVKTGSPNLLLQVPIYTGPPTPPTRSPTSPPTFAPPTFCVNNGKTCADFAQSTFGPVIPDDSMLSGELVVADELLCEPTTQDFTGKIVLVARGNCLFFTKVENAEKRGAIAVAIHLTSKSETPFPPAYYGDGDVDIPSAMIGLTDANNMMKHEGKVAGWGSESATVAPTPPTKSPTPTASPTDQPSTSPTPAPTQSCAEMSRKSCSRADHCVYYRDPITRSRNCLDKSSTPAPTTAAPTTPVDCEELGKRDCGKHDHCFYFRDPITRKKSCIYKADTPAPTTPPEIITPNGCQTGTLAEAEEVCSGLSARMCTVTDLANAEKDPLDVCNFDEAYVWAADTCSKGRSRVYQRSRNKKLCKNPDEEMAIRCCI